MKGFGALQKLDSWLTASTADGSVARWESFSPGDGGTPGPESERSLRQSFFLSQEFAVKARVASLAEKVAANVSARKSEHSESESDDKLNKAFNIDPVVTMIPRSQKRAFVQRLFADSDLNFSLKEPTRIAPPTDNPNIALSDESVSWRAAASENSSQSFFGFAAPPSYFPADYYTQFAVSDPPPTAPARRRAAPRQTQSAVRYVPQGTASENRVELARIEEIGKKALYVKNIPNKYTKKMLLRLFDQDFKGEYDFFYLPIDFNNNCNIGFAFIKFIELSSVRRFCQKYANKKWPNFNSEKICEIRYARMQRAEEMIEHFKNSSLWRKADPRCLPFMAPSALRPN